MRSLPIFLLLTVGCTDVAGDAKDDSFGGADVKEDGQYSPCQLAEVLKLVNNSNATSDYLQDKVGLAENAARAITKHKNGPDGDLGTGDDDIFDDLGELDGVDYVGRERDANHLGEVAEAVAVGVALGGIGECTGSTTRPLWH